YQFAHQLGPYGYADPGNFAPTYDHRAFMRMLENEEQRSSERFVKHFRGKYTSEEYLPIWMATELVSFGAISKLTENARASLRNRVAREFGLVEPVFISWLHTIAYVRNVCAHHSRLWNRELGVMPQLPAEWTSKGIENDKIYCVALMLQHFLKLVAPASRWKERMKELFAE